MSAPAFQGSTISITATKSALGDGFVNVGFIEASGRDLAGVTVDGDLGQIHAGDSDSSTPAITSLSVHSMGRLGLSNQPMGASDILSEVFGKVGTLNITTDFVEAGFSVTGAAGVDSHGQPTNFGQIGTLKIGGSIHRRSS